MYVVISGKWVAVRKRGIATYRKRVVVSSKNVIVGRSWLGVKRRS